MYDQFLAGNRHLLACDPMWKKLLENYKDRDLIMHAEDFPKDVKAFEDRSHQRGEKARDRYQELETQEKKKFEQQEIKDRDAWLKKQEGYNPYAHE